MRDTHGEKGEGRKTAWEVFWCLFLTDEGCPLLTLSGKLETGVEIVNPESNGDCKLWGQITRVPLFSVTATTVGNGLLRLYRQTKYRWPICIKVLKYSLLGLEGMEGYVSILVPSQMENSLWIPIRSYSIKGTTKTKMSG